MLGERKPRTDVGVVASLFILEAAALILAMAAYKNAGNAPKLLLTGQYRGFFLASAASVAGAAAYLIVKYRRALDDARRHIRLVIGMNLVLVTTSVVLGETAIRGFQSRDALGSTFLGTRLRPRRWEDARERNRSLLDASPNEVAYLVSDDLLGWSIGPSRRSTDGLYSSSVEGIRSAEVGVRYAGQQPTHRVALVGDSFTFGLEVPFDATWGQRLQTALGPDVQVLNFGVDGYGVDQAYLRYSKDVEAWEPELVVFSFIGNDLYRSMAVYTFVSFPEWGFPFAKPRFAVREGALRLLNSPVPDPRELLTHRAVSELPYVEYDRGYDPDEWRWRFYHRSYLIRYLLSRFPRWPELSPEVSDQAVDSLNGAIFAAFARDAKANGSAPLVVYLPSRSDFRGLNRREKEAAFAVLQREQIAHLDLTTCLQEKLDVSGLFIPGRPHYSAGGNQAVAECLLPRIRAGLP